MDTILQKLISKNVGRVLVMRTAVLARRTGVSVGPDRQLFEVILIFLISFTIHPIITTSLAALYLYDTVSPAPRPHSQTFT
ncbi:hypothetical protein J6590_005798 [Homalodisca vitripennis]|nr:hypothetical protein J6590_005798 [Homalodisca vitripennis]